MYVALSLCLFLPDQLCAAHSVWNCANSPHTNLIVVFIVPRSATHAQPCVHMPTGLFQRPLFILNSLKCKFHGLPHSVHTPRRWVFYFPLTMSDDEEPLDISSLTQEERIQLALKAIVTSGVHASGRTKLSVRQAAVTFNVPRSTLQDRFNGWKTRHEGHAHEQNLTPAQEDIVVEWVKVLGQRGVPLTQATLRDCASDICGKPIGETWPKRFIARHPDIKVKWTTSLERCRAQGLNRIVVTEYFNMLKELINKYQILDENIYNMDEKGIQLGIGTRVAALVDRAQQTAYQVEDGDRELVTILETICADGSSIQPSVIVQGKKRDLEWGRVNPCNAR